MEVASHLDHYEDGENFSAFAASTGVPRSTLRDAQQRRERLYESAEVLEEAVFFESAAGQRVLHRLLIASHVMMGLVGQGGIRLVGQFIELAGLAAYLATSYSAQRRFQMRVTEQVLDFARQQTHALGASMQRQDVTLCGDETFHQEGACLVAIEPVSNFIVLEGHRLHYDADTWKTALDEALRPLNVNVIQWCGDMAPQFDALCHTLGCHRGPDLMHLQQPVVRATARALGKQVAESEKALQAQREKVRAFERALGPDGVQTMPDCEQALKLQERAGEALREAEKKATAQARMSDLILDISECYHPFEMDTGVPREESALHSALEQTLEALLEHGRACGLRERFEVALKKLERWSAQMVATLSFFWAEVHARVAQLELSEEGEKVFVSHWLAGEYVALARGRCRSADRRQELAELEQQLKTQLADEPWYRKLSEAERERLHRQAREMAGLWQRSSSCVEGRNGYLALFHHALHRLSPDKLAALTAIHNFFIKRRDSTTPAARFFGRKHDDLFEYLCRNVKPIGYPAKKRGRAV